MKCWIFLFLFIIISEEQNTQHTLRLDSSAKIGNPNEDDELMCGLPIWKYEGATSNNVVTEIDNGLKLFADDPQPLSVSQKEGRPTEELEKPTYTKGNGQPVIGLTGNTTDEVIHAKPDAETIHSGTPTEEIEKPTYTKGNGQPEIGLTGNTTDEVIHANPDSVTLHSGRPTEELEMPTYTKGNGQPEIGHTEMLPDKIHDVQPEQVSISDRAIAVFKNNLNSPLNCNALKNLNKRYWGENQWFVSCEKLPSLPGTIVFMVTLHERLLSRVRQSNDVHLRWWTINRLLNNAGESCNSASVPAGYVCAISNLRTDSVILTGFFTSHFCEKLRKKDFVQFQLLKCELYFLRPASNMGIASYLVRLSKSATVDHMSKIIVYVNNNIAECEYHLST